MGCVQAMQPPFCKVSLRPALIPRYSLGIPAMSFEKDSSQATPNRFVVFPEDAPVTVSEVVEPSLNGPVDVLDDGLQ